MASGDPLVREKIEQVPAILDELGLDLWMLFSRESATARSLNASSTSPGAARGSFCRTRRSTSAARAASSVPHTFLR